MNVTQIVAYLRSSVNIQQAGTQDTAYLSMSDDEILLYLNVVLTRDFGDIPSLDYLPNSGVYPLTLLAKKELYYALAVVSAPDYDLGADSNNYLKQDERFQHYMKLIAQVDGEYQKYLDDGGGLSEDGAGTNTLTSTDVVLSNRYYTRQYYEKGASPAPLLYVDTTTDSTVEFHWKNKVRKFAWSNIYLSTSPVYDPYLNGSKIVDASTLVKRLTDPRQVTMRLEGLEPNTKYYLVVEVVDMSALKGYACADFTTAEVKQ